MGRVRMRITECKQIGHKMEVITRDMTPEEEAEYNKSISEVPQEPTYEDRLQAQVLYTALMTDTLLEE